MVFVAEKGFIQVADQHGLIPEIDVLPQSVLQADSRSIYLLAMARNVGDHHTGNRSVAACRQVIKIAAPPGWPQGIARNPGGQPRQSGSVRRQMISAAQFQAREALNLAGASGHWLTRGRRSILRSAPAKRSAPDNEWTSQPIARVERLRGLRKAHFLDIAQEDSLTVARLESVSMPACSHSTRSTLRLLPAATARSRANRSAGIRATSMVGRSVRKNMRTSFIAMEQSQLLNLELARN